MRKLVPYIATSLDGYIARSSGAVDWLYTDQDYGYTEFLGGIDTVLMGRKTYAQLEGFGPYPYSGRRGFVFSRTPRQPTADETKATGEYLASHSDHRERAVSNLIWGLLASNEFCANH